MKNKKIRVTRTGRRLLHLFTICLTLGFCLTSCNVTRVVSTESQYYQKGDTACYIQTKTIETYDASKKL